MGPRYTAILAEAQPAKLAHPEANENWVKKKLGMVGAEATLAG